ncbi:MAG TPA: ABC transporter ATP-binding protein [Candidatus Angelobacter sp.]|nr:ABC transporter ATP-binding protein [Candidatus Angelobacter sp.]
MTSGNQGLAKTEPLFRVSSLSVEYDAAGGDLVHALRGVDLEISPGQTVGVLGESGSGKSSLALALMRLLPRNARITAGQIHHRGRNLAGFSAKQLREMRGAEVALISQEPALALNPVLPLGTQIIDVLKAHTALKRTQLAERTREMLRDVGFDDPERIMRAYPHQLSGGQRQRVAIAQALICRPQLLIADEPLSALDVATQAEIVELLQRLKSELNLSILFVTHNARVLSSLVDQAIVLHEGAVLAQGSINKLQNSADPYIQSLLFPERNILEATKLPKPPGTEYPFLGVRDLGKKFTQRHVFSRSKFTVQALEHIDLELQEGTATAVLGRSGSGKSTLARCIAGFETADSGTIMLQGRLLAPHPHNGSAHKWAEPHAVQMIFQDAATSLNPRLTARQIVAEPLEIAHWKTELERATRALELMAEVGLNADWSERLAGEFSGGQRQRLALARALAAEPKLLIMDEALSGLDMPRQAQMVRLLMDLQARHGLTYLYISHDLNFISLFAQEVVVMESGKIVERLAPSRLNEGKHPATRMLVEASERLHVPGVEVTA